MTNSTPDSSVLTDEAIAEIEARKVVDHHLKSGAYIGCYILLSTSERNALCATVKQLRADLKYRCEALEELRRCRDRWLTMLNPASADETVDGAIRNLQQAYISERDNAADLQSQLEQLRAENNDEKEYSNSLALKYTVLEQRLAQCEGSRRVHELDNHHNALACSYCAGPLKDELMRLKSIVEKL